MRTGHTGSICWRLQSADPFFYSDRARSAIEDIQICNLSVAKSIAVAFPPFTFYPAVQGTAAFSRMPSFRRWKRITFLDVVGGWLNRPSEGRVEDGDSAGKEFGDNDAMEEPSPGGPLYSWVFHSGCGRRAGSWGFLTLEFAKGSDKCESRECIDQKSMSNVSMSKWYVQQFVVLQIRNFDTGSRDVFIRIHNRYWAL